MFKIYLFIWFEGLILHIYLKKENCTLYGLLFINLDNKANLVEVRIIITFSKINNPHLLENQSKHNNQ